MVKKTLFYFIAFTILLLNITNAYGQPPLLCESSILIDAKTGTVLASKDPQKKLYPASLTKIMTAIIAIEKGNLTDIITVDADTPYEISGSHIALEPGEILTLKDLLYALMLPSANDAASVIAKNYANGSQDDFVKMMNAKAQELGALNTHFANPHGLHDPNHYTTAADLALITKYAMQNETFRSIVGTTKYEIQPTNKKNEIRYFTTLNKLLYSTKNNQINIDGNWISPVYSGTTGVKTGYTGEAGNCLVASAKKGNIDLIVVALKGVSLEMYSDAHNLFNYGFTEYENINLTDRHVFVQNIDIAGGDIKQISAITQNELSVLVKKGDSSKVESKVTIDEIKLPIEANSLIGKIEFTLGGKPVGQVALISPVAVAKLNTDANKTIFKFPFIIKLIIILAILILGIRTYNKMRIKNIRKKRKLKKQNNSDI